MRSPVVRGAIALGAVVLVVVLFIALAGGDDDSGDGSQTTQATQVQPTQGIPGGTTDAPPPPPAPPPAEQIVVRGAKPVGGVKRLEYDKGDRIRFVVKSDVSDEVHVHGFDVSKPVAAGGSVRFGFPADIEGVFEVELENRAVPIAELRVNP